MISTIYEHYYQPIWNNDIDKIRQLNEIDNISFNIPIDSEDFNPVTFALTLGRHQIAKYFIENGACLDYKVTQFKLPMLQFSFENKQYELIDTLLKYGANKNEKYISFGQNNHTIAEFVQLYNDDNIKEIFNQYN